ncbi:hypothetical protein LCGC14_2277610 [marine sediment metagenome]|uniref:DUF5675 domain-containing protein n=1 Tax=marine sediment metagenome TaxID=412755 RepID=A0A0F9FQ82_9ZZZZ
MRTLSLSREPSTDTEMMGSLTFDNVSVHTIERPWLPTDPGGMPFESSVPAGRYELVPHVRSNGDIVRALVNPGLGVYYLKGDRTNSVGRYLILIHAGNWVTDIVGCIAPGYGRTVSGKGPMVTQSRKAMSLLMNWLGDDEAEIIIRDSE